MIWSCVAEYRKNEPSKFPFGNSEVAQKREPPGSLFCFIGNASYEIKTLRLGCALGPSHTHFARIASAMRRAPAPSIAIRIRSDCFFRASGFFRSAVSFSTASS